MNIQIRTFLILFFTVCFLTFGQKTNDLDKYKEAKAKLESEDFQESIRLFTELYKGLDEKSEYAPYCYYFAAYSHYRFGNLKDANYTLFQLINKYPTWQSINMAYYLKAVVQAESRNYVDAIVQFGKTGSAFPDDVKKAKGSFLDKISTDTLMLLSRKFPDDELIRLVLASKQPKSMQSKANVAILLPFSDASKNHYIYELYKGMQLASDSLKKTGMNLEFTTFDTGKDTVKVKDFINLPGAKNFDLIVGPLYSGQQSFISKFAFSNKVNVVNPLSSYCIPANTNANYFLLRPSYETQGKAAADFAYNNFTLKNAVVIYGEDGGDSISANSFKCQYEERGGKVLIFRYLTKSNSGYFAPILGKVPLDSVGHIYIASSQSSLAANVFSHLEAVLLDQTSKYKDIRTEEEKELDRKKKETEKPKRVVSDLPVIVPSSWLDFETISYEQFSLHNTHFIYPDFVQSEISSTSFYNNYLNKVGLYPTNYTYQGFDLIMYFGRMLNKYTKRFDEKIKNEGISKGFALQYIDYHEQNDNQFVPIVKIEDFKLKLVNQPENFSEKR